jgi:hypothetical protein
LVASALLAGPRSPRDATATIYAMSRAAATQLSWWLSAALEIIDNNLSDGNVMVLVQTQRLGAVVHRHHPGNAMTHDDAWSRCNR